MGSLVNAIGNCISWLNTMVQNIISYYTVDSTETTVDSNTITCDKI